jgi:hypothetical protein
LPALNALKTRQRTAANTTTKTRKELEDAANTLTSISSKQQAINYLTAADYLLPGKKIDMHILSYVLLQFAVNGKTPKLVTDRIRVVAILMEDAYVLHIADSITDIVKKKIEEQMETFTGSMET